MTVKEALAAIRKADIVFARVYITANDCDIVKISKVAAIAMVNGRGEADIKADWCATGFNERVGELVLG